LRNFITSFLEPIRGNNKNSNEKNFEPNKEKSNIVFISKSELDFIAESIFEKLKQKDVETGGILFGKRTKMGITIAKATDAGPKAECYSTEFAPDIEYGQKILNDLRTRHDVFYIGTWHKHPNYLPHVSSGDIRQMEEIIEDNDTLDEFVSLIVTLADRTPNYNFFYMGKDKVCIKVNFIAVEDKSEILKEIDSEPFCKDFKSNILDIKHSIPVNKHKIENDAEFANFNSNYLLDPKERINNEINELKSLRYVQNVSAKPTGDILEIKVQCSNNCNPIIFFCPPEFPLNPPLVFYLSDESAKNFEKCYVEGWNSLWSLCDVMEKIKNSTELYKKY
jgi:integrative and conjugative element protein (TIGR02256 family)